MTRVKGWEKILIEQIASAKDKPFEWGKFDCATWACDVVLALTGVDLAGEFRGKYSSEEEATQLIKDFAGSDIEALAVKVAAANSLKEVSIKFASRGDIVVIKQGDGKALGIVGSDARYVFATTEKGLTRFPQKYWIRAFATR